MYWGVPGCGHRASSWWLRGKRAWALRKRGLKPFQQRHFFVDQISRRNTSHRFEHLRLKHSDKDVGENGGKCCVRPQYRWRALPETELTVVLSCSDPQGHFLTAHKYRRGGVL